MLAALMGSKFSTALALSCCSRPFCDESLGAFLNAATGSLCESAGDGTAVFSSLETLLGPLAVAALLLRTGAGDASVTEGASLPAAMEFEMSEEREVCTAESVGARYCCLKLFAEVDGHMPGAGTPGRLGSWEDDMGGIEKVLNKEEEELGNSKD